MSRRNPVRTRNGPKPAQYLGMHIDASGDAPPGHLSFYSFTLYAPWVIFIDYIYRRSHRTSSMRGGCAARLPLFVHFPVLATVWIVSTVVIAGWQPIR